MKEEDDDRIQNTAEFAFGVRTPRERGGDLSHDDDVQYRTAYEGSPHRLAERSYEDVRPAYRLGHFAGQNPQYQGQSFEAIEQEVQLGWAGDLRQRHGEWNLVRPFARDAYQRRLASVTERENANRALNSSENLSDPVAQKN